MTLIYVLLVAHFVGDFLCQSDWMAIHKSKRWDALVLHVAVYATALYVCLALTHALGLWWNFNLGWEGLTFIGVNASAHFVQDAITSRINARLWFFRPMFQNAKPVAVSYGSDQWCDGWVQRGGNRHWFFVSIGFDQLLHYATLFVTAGWWLQ